MAFGFDHGPLQDALAQLLGHEKGVGLPSVILDHKRKEYGMFVSSNVSPHVLQELLGSWFMSSDLPRCFPWHLVILPGVGRCGLGELGNHVRMLSQECSYINNTQYHEHRLSLNSMNTDRPSMRC